ncbi:MAG: dihydrolipoyl dehydrogenase family protein [Desulfobacterales bacterium]
MNQFDVVVVGSGTAGQTAAYDLREKGLKVAVIERSDRPGGTCALTGCQPKKYFYEITEAVARCRHLQGSGIIAPPAGSWPQVRTRKNEFTSPIPDRTVEGLRDAGIEFLRGNARYADADTLVLDDRQIHARYHVLATGAVPMPLPFEGNRHLIDNEAFLDIEELPSRIVFVGGGFISFEFAHFAARLGPDDARIHIIEAMERPLGPFDAEMVDLLVEASEEDGIEVRSGVEITSVDRHSGGFTVATASGAPLEADLVVHGAGRSPAIEGMNLEAAGIEFTRKGIKVDDAMRTSHPRVFAVGDCAETIQLARVADREAHVAAENILADMGGAELSRIDYDTVPVLLFTYPQYGMVGKTEEQLGKDGTEYRESSGDHLSWPTYRRVGLRHAAYKILAGSDRRILGAHFISDNATGLVNTLRHAMMEGLTVDALHERSIVTPYPSRESDLIYMLEPLLS